MQIGPADNAGAGRPGPGQADGVRGGRDGPLGDGPAAGGGGFPLHVDQILDGQTDTRS